ncbi:MAG: hypothetical protein HZB23_14970 [Deltaproteobacteria bacterium]|nr:hypothetical protein [Deltaproteobacteria bacterium]
MKETGPKGSGKPVWRLFQQADPVKTNGIERNAISFVALYFYDCRTTGRNRLPFWLPATGPPVQKALVMDSFWLTRDTNRVNRFLLVRPDPGRLFGTPGMILIGRFHRNMLRLSPREAAISGPRHFHPAIKQAVGHFDTNLLSLFGL